MSEKEELRQMLGEQEEQASIALQEETHNLRVQNQDLQHKVSRPGIIQTVWNSTVVIFLSITCKHDDDVIVSCHSCKSRVLRSRN